MAKIIRSFNHFGIAEEVIEVLAKHKIPAYYRKDVFDAVESILETKTIQREGTQPVPSEYSIYFDVCDYSKSELQQIYDKLSGWEWSSLLGEKPEWWDKAKRYCATDDKRIKTLFDIIAPVIYKIQEEPNKHVKSKFVGVTRSEKVKEALRSAVFNAMQSLADEGVIESPSMINGTIEGDIKHLRMTFKCSEEE